MFAPKLAWCALAAAIAQGARFARKASSKTLAGKPVYNYELRHLQNPEVQGASAEYDWVLVFKGLSDQQMEEFCDGGRCKAAGHPSTGVPFATVRGTEADLEKLLKGNSEVVDFAEPDLPVFEIPEIEDRSAEKAQVDHWGLDRIGLSQATYTGKGVHIYVMDTGVRTTHEEFGGRAVPTVDTIAGGGTAIECNGDPTCATDTSSGHGTHVAGTTGGANYGVATDATIHAMKVCCGYGTNTLAGMDWIARKAEKPAIMTMSLGSYGQSMSAKAAVDTLVAAGVTVFVSSGNNNIDACGKTYAFIESAIVVGASNKTDTRASWSNYGTCNDIFAPGVSIPSASNRTDDGLRTISGTSMATPMVAGVGALLLEEDPSLTPAGLRQKLLGMASKNALSNLKAGDPNLLLSAV